MEQFIVLILCLLIFRAKLEDLEENDLNMDLNMQLGGAILFSKYILKFFSENKGGNFIHISSIQGLGAPKFEHYEGTSMHSPIEYTAIKAGIIAITKWLAKYYKGKNIRVNCISPGGILDNQPKEFLAKYRESCTNFGMLNSSQVSELIIFYLFYLTILKPLTAKILLLMMDGVCN